MVWLDRLDLRFIKSKKNGEKCDTHFLMLVAKTINHKMKTDVQNQWKLYNAVTTTCHTALLNNPVVKKQNKKKHSEILRDC